MNNAALKIALDLIDNATAPMLMSLSAIEESTRSLDLRMSGLSTTVRALGAAFGAWQVYELAGQLINLTDKYTLLENRLSLVTDSASELANVQEDLYRITMDTHGAYDATVTMYTRFAQATRDADVSQQDLLTITRAVNEAILVSGATAQEAEAAIIQLSQGLASGALRGEELNSVLEQTPRVAQMIADGLEISRGELRAWGQEGKLTTEMVLEALKSQATAVHDEFGQMSITVGQAWQDVKTVFADIITDGSEAASVTEILAGEIEDFALYLDDHRDVIRDFFLGGLEGAKEFWEEAAPILDGLWEGTKKIIDGYNNLDPVVKEYGLILAIFGGRKGRAVLGAWAAASALGEDLSDSLLKLMGIAKQPVPESGGMLGFWKKYDAAVGRAIEAMKKWYAEHPDAQKFFGIYVNSTEKAAEATEELGAISTDMAGTVNTSTTSISSATGKMSDSSRKSLSALEKKILDTGKSYDVMAADWMDARDVLTRNIIDQDDLIPDSTIDAINADLDQLMQDSSELWEDYSDDVVRINEQLAGDLGRIMDDYINQVLRGEINTIEDLFEGLFDSILDMFSRTLSQMAANSMVDAIFGTGASGGLTLSSAGALASASGVTSLLGSSSLMMGLDAIFNTDGSMTALSGTYALATDSFTSWAMDAAGWGSLDAFGDALVGFSDSLQPVADWLTDLSFVLDDMPIVGDLGLGGTLSGISAIYNFAEGNTTDAIIDTAIAGLFAWDPVIGGAVSVGYAIGEFIADIFGLGSEPSPPSVTVGPYPGVPAPMMGWQYAPTADDPYNLSTFRSYTITATNSGDPDQYAAAYQAIIDSWADVIEGVASVMGEELGTEWLSEYFSGVENQLFPWWSGVAAVTQTGNIDPSRFVDQMNNAAYAALREPLNEAMNMMWQDVRDNSGVWDILTPEMRLQTSQVVWDLPHTEGSYLDFAQNFTDYMTGLSAVAMGLDAILQVTEEITAVVEGGTIDRYTLELAAINDQFDAYAAQLADMGVDLTVYTDLERGRQIAISDWVEQITADLSTIIDLHEKTDLERAMDDLQAWYDQQLEMAAALREAMTPDDYATWLADVSLAAEYQARELIDGYVSPITDAIADQLLALTTSSLNPALPEDRLDQLDQVYESLFAEAMTGDQAAINDYLGFVSTYLDQQQDIYKSSDTYRQIYEQVQSDMATIGYAAVAQVPTVEFDSEELAAAVSSGINDEIAELRTAIENLQIQVNVAASIDGRDLAIATTEVASQITDFSRVGI